MTAFIIASDGGDIYAVTGNVMSYQSPMHVHVHMRTHAMNDCDVLRCWPFLTQATHSCAAEEDLITLRKPELYCFPSDAESIYFVLEKLINQ